MNWLRRRPGAPGNGAGPEPLNIRPNMIVEVLTTKNILIFIGRVQSFDGQALVVRDAQDGTLPSVVYNQAVKLRFSQKNHTLVIHGLVCGSSPLIWKVDRLKSHLVVERRNTFRQNVDLGAEVILLASSQPTEQIGVPMRGRVLDISLGGLLLSCSGGLRMGDRLSVSQVVPAAGQPPFSFLCQVRRIQIVDGKYLYGCKADRLPPKEEDRLLQAIFNIQRRDLSRRRTGRS